MPANKEFARPFMGKILWLASNVPGEIPAPR